MRWRSIPSNPTNQHDIASGCSALCQARWSELSGHSASSSTSIALSAWVQSVLAAHGPNRYSLYRRKFRPAARMSNPRHIRVAEQPTSISEQNRLRGNGTRLPRPRYGRHGPLGILEVYWWRPGSITRNQYRSQHLLSVRWPRKR